MGGVRLRLDAERWREHLDVVARATPGLVPVIKGNGYGFGRTRLAEAATELGSDTIGVGVAAEVPLVRPHFAGDVVILQPWDSADEAARAALTNPRVITTVSRLADLDAIADSDLEPRVLVEVLTSMRRHGIPPTDLGWVTPLLQRVRFEGWSIHLPLRVEGRLAEAVRLAGAALRVAPGPLWLSHLPPEEASSASSTAQGRCPYGSGVGTPAMAGWARSPTGRRLPRCSTCIRSGAGAGRIPGPARPGRRVDRGDRRRHGTRHRSRGPHLGNHRSAAGDLGGYWITGGRGAGAQPVHDQR